MEYILEGIEQEKRTLGTQIESLGGKFAAALREAYMLHDELLLRAAESDEFDELDEQGAQERAQLPTGSVMRVPLEDKSAPSLRRLQTILEDSADDNDAQLRRVAQISSGVFGVQAIAVVKA